MYYVFSEYYYQIWISTGETNMCTNDCFEIVRFKTRVEY